MQGKEIQANETSYADFEELINLFKLYDGKPITNSKKLAEFMATKAKLLEEAIIKMDLSNSSLNPNRSLEL
ncbi:MAG: hypothetical protein LBB73_01835 [Dysgonamonadaceae bacterium]|jgi:hypothetical protein|nr:hypothetical protein [Dysgonamonadaceae bacterium]